MYMKEKERISRQVKLKEIKMNKKMHGADSS